MFEYLNKILFKTKGLDTSNIDEVKEFQPYLIQRWCSMYSPQVSNLVNQTSNRVWPVLDNNTAWFNYLHGVIPACKFKRTSYIKKKKETESVTNSKQAVKTLANHLEISAREVNQYIELFNLKLPNEKKPTTQD
jgi:hypothetical protein